MADNAQLANLGHQKKGQLNGPESSIWTGQPGGRRANVCCSPKADMRKHCFAEPRVLQLGGSLQAFHFMSKLKAQLISFFVWKPLCHVRENGLPHSSISL